MNCPKCNGAVFVVDSRPTDGTIIRRRCCQECGNRFSTYEVSKEQYNLLKKIRDVLKNENGGTQDG